MRCPRPPVTALAENSAWVWPLFVEPARQKSSRDRDRLGSSVDKSSSLVVKSAIGLEKQLTANQARNCGCRSGPEYGYTAPAGAAAKGDGVGPAAARGSPMLRAARHSASAPRRPEPRTTAVTEVQPAPLLLRVFSCGVSELLSPGARLCRSPRTHAAAAAGLACSSCIVCC